MKTVAVALAVLVVAQALPPLFFQQPQTEQRGKFITKSFTRISHQATRVGADLCPICIDFAGQAIDEIVNIILNVGVIGTCGELCQLLAQKTGSQILGAVCDILCDVVGIEEFIKMIEKADLDPIYFCELVKVCPINDHGDATITELSITPVKGPQGPRTIDLSFTSKNGTGTGELIIFIRTVDGIPVETGFLNKLSPPGVYPMTFNLKAEPDPDCDPSQGFCEQWLPGNYTLRADICNGECGSKHPHSQMYDRKETNFTITKE